jgi:hypothetical protein
MKKTPMSCLVVTTLLAILVLPRAALAQGTERPIEDFVSAQGTFCLDDGAGGCVLFVPPVANFIGWGSATSANVASVDYAGLADRWITAASCVRPVSFGTSFAGTVVEEPLADGRVLVTVDLTTFNALTFVASGDFANGDLVFGVRAPDVCNGSAEPALGASRLHIAFTNPAPGAPLPDLIQLFFFPGPGQAFQNYAFTAQARSGSSSAKVVQTANVARTNVQAARVEVTQR